MNTTTETDTAETKSNDDKKSRKPEWLETLHRLWGEGVVLVPQEDDLDSNFADFSQDAWA